MVSQASSIRQSWLSSDPFTLTMTSSGSNSNPNFADYLTGLLHYHRFYTYGMMYPFVMLQYNILYVHKLHLVALPEISFCLYFMLYIILHSQLNRHILLSKNETSHPGHREKERATQLLIQWRVSSYQVLRHQLLGNMGTICWSLLVPTREAFGLFQQRSNVLVFIDGQSFFLIAWDICISSSSW